MARDLDLIRKIMFEIDQKENGHDIVKLELEGYTEDQIQFQLALMNEAGLIKAYVFSSDNRQEYAPTRLTWSGHDFLDAARDDTRWARAKSILNEVKDYSLDLAIKVLSELAVSAARKAMGL